MLIIILALATLAHGFENSCHRLSDCPHGKRCMIKFADPRWGELKVCTATSCFFDNNGGLAICIPLTSALTSASCTTSSSIGNYWSCEKAFDNDPTTDWATDNEGTGSWIQTNFGASKQVGQFTYRHGNQPGEDNKEVTLSFSDGSSQTFTLEKEPLEINKRYTLLQSFAIVPVHTTFVNLTVNSVYGSQESTAQVINYYECNPDTCQSPVGGEEYNVKCVQNSDCSSNNCVQNFYTEYTCQCKNDTFCDANQHCHKRDSDSGTCQWTNIDLSSWVKIGDGECRNSSDLSPVHSSYTKLSLNECQIKAGTIDGVTAFEYVYKWCDDEPTWHCDYCKVFTGVVTHAWQRSPHYYEGHVCYKTPTKSPTASPTGSPTTSSPTTSPTGSPTGSPTTSSPTTSPTGSPTTSSPTTSPNDVAGSTIKDEASSAMMVTAGVVSTLALLAL